MAKKKKKKKQLIPRIEPAAVDGLPLRFSFTYLDSQNPKFLPTECCAEYFHCLFQTLRRFSASTVGDFTDPNNDERRHPIFFDQTTEPEGFQHIHGMDEEQLGIYEGWQFAVHPEQPWINDWRAHGILVDDTFFVIWLDPHHRLYPRPNVAPAQEF